MAEQPTNAELKQRVQAVEGNASHSITLYFSLTIYLQLPLLQGVETRMQLPNHIIHIALHLIHITLQPVVAAINTNITEHLDRIEIGP